METSNISKRKRRKTRKCLDELRKRSRCNTHLNDSTKKSTVTEVNGEVSDSNGIRVGRTYITANRLTLAMFPRAVRSETITRPVLSEIKNESKLNIMNNIIGNKGSINNEMTEYVKEALTKNIEVVRETDNESNEDFEKEKIITISNSSQGNISDCINNSLGSPNPVVGSDSKTESPVIQLTSSETSPSSLISQEEHENKLYEEFMNEIPMYIKENFPCLLKREVIKRTKTHLQNAFTERYHQETENNTLECISNNVNNRSCTVIDGKEAIVQNPMDYIKLGCAWKQSSVQNNRTNRPVSSSASSQSSVIHSAPDSYSPPTCSIIEDTPEYTYYPHKLNK